MSNASDIKKMLSRSTTMPLGAGQSSPFGGPLLTGSSLHSHAHGAGCGCAHSHDDENEE